MNPEFIMIEGKTTMIYIYCKYGKQILINLPESAMKNMTLYDANSSKCIDCMHTELQNEKAKILEEMLQGEKVTVYSREWL